MIWFSMFVLSLVAVFLVFWERVFMILVAFGPSGAHLRRQRHPEARKDPKVQKTHTLVEVISGSIGERRGTTICNDFYTFF